MQIRKSVRKGLKAIIDKVGVTSILVTHDQEEAFDLADQIVIFNRCAQKINCKDSGRISLTGALFMCCLCCKLQSRLTELAFVSLWTLEDQVCQHGCMIMCLRAWHAPFMGGPYVAGCMQEWLMIFEFSFAGGRWSKWETGIRYAGRLRHPLC